MEYLKRTTMEIWGQCLTSQEGTGWPGLGKIVCMWLRGLSCLLNLASLPPPSSFHVTHIHSAVPVLQGTLFGTLLYAPPDLLSPQSIGQVPEWLVIILRETWSPAVY